MCYSIKDDMFMYKPKRAQNVDDHIRQMLRTAEITTFHRNIRPHKKLTEHGTNGQNEQYNAVINNLRIEDHIYPSTAVRRHNESSVYLKWNDNSGSNYTVPLNHIKEIKYKREHENSWLSESALSGDYLPSTLTICVGHYRYSFTEVDLDFVRRLKLKCNIDSI